LIDHRLKHAANWLSRFTVNGVAPSDFHDVLSSLTSWDDWCGAWSERAKVHEYLGHEALEGKCFISAAEHLSRAAVTYHFAKYLFVQDMAQLRAAHAKAVECLDAALPYLDPPGMRVLIPFEGKHLAGTLRLPRHVQGGCPPLVLMTMGLDSTKEELLTFEMNFLDRGMAILAFDGPGQGEAEYDFAIRHDYENVVAQVIDWVEANVTEVDASRIGIWGISLGGYYAPRAAAFEPRARACIALGGPFDWAAAWDGLPQLTREAFRVRSHCASADAARRHAATLTLVGIAQRITCPIYIMNGRQDRIVPSGDAERLAREVKGPVTLHMIEDGNHVATNRAYRWRSDSADWMAEQLRAG
jgi:2,6-dihydroxypseudooxynicotine hydrolase